MAAKERCYIATLSSPCHAMLGTAAAVLVGCSVRKMQGSISKSSRKGSQKKITLVSEAPSRHHQTKAVMSSASSAVTYTSVYTDSEPGRAFWGADDEEISEGGIPRVIVLGYDGLPIQPVAPPSPDYIPGPEDPQTPPVPQDEDEREPMFVQAHDPDYVPEPIYPEYIPLEDEHEFPAEEQPLPPVDSPTAESPRYVTESDPEEDPEEYEDDETEDGPVDYPIDGGDDGDDDDGDSSGDDADDEDEDDEDEEEHLAPADSAVVVPADEPVSPPEGTEPVIPPPSTDITIGARITVRPQASISLPPEAEALIDAVTAVLPSPLLPPSLYIPPPVDRRDDIPESEQPPRKRLCLSTLGSRYEIGESSTASPTRDQGVDYGFVSTVDAEARRQGISDVGVTKLAKLHEHDTQDLYALLEDAQDSRCRISHRVNMDSQRVDLLMGDRMTLQETVWMVEEEAYASREAWAHSIGLSQATHQELQTHRDHVHETRFQMWQAELAALRETDHRRQVQMIETLRVMRDIRREMGDMQAELLALREQRRRARQPAPDTRIPDHQEASGDADSHGTKGVVGLTRWIEKMESVFNISGCAIESQVKFATCTLLGAALTWWNGQIRTLGPEAYAMTWEVLKKKMTDKHCRQGEIKKLEIELWNLKVKGNDVPAYTERFQELTLICTKFVANETEKVDKYISGLPDNIYGNIKSARPKTLDETIELANDLMDKKLRTYAERQFDNKRKADDSSRKNHGEKKPYGGFLPKSTGNTNVANTQKGNRVAPKGNVGNVEKRGNASGNPDSNVVTGTFLLNNHYASILFDTGVDRSFISTAFSSLIDIVLTPLDNSYDVELANGKIVGIDTIIRGCTLNFLDRPFHIDLMPVELGSFDVIIGMDCSNGRESWLTVISCSKAQEYMAKGCQVFLAQISAKKEEDKSEGKQIKDVPIVRDFPEVFPEDLPGLSPA
ncbi:putative reverse transcriptase domain-containing protein [Tanacetum coccineum]